MNEQVAVSVTAGFYQRGGAWNFLVFRPVLLGIEDRRMRLTDRKERVVLEAATAEVSARFSSVGTMRLSHRDRRYFLHQEGAGWSRGFSTAQRATLTAAGMPVPGVAGGSGGSAGLDGIIQALGAVTDIADAVGQLGSGGSLARIWTPVLTHVGCHVEG